MEIIYTQKKIRKMREMYLHVNNYEIYEGKVHYGLKTQNDNKETENSRVSYSQLANR